jgi:hypothetical protein
MCATTAQRNAINPIVTVIEFHFLLSRQIVHVADSNSPTD